MVFRFQSLEVERTRKMEGDRGLFLFHIYILYSLIKVQETAWSPSYSKNKTYEQFNDPFHPLMGKIKPFEPREAPSS